jgi:predicted  nucleic acid-binding Zn ribbon protein
MYTAKITFLNERDVDSQEHARAAGSLLAHWFQNGQLTGEQLYARSGANLDVFSTLPCEDALEALHDNPRTSRARSEWGVGTIVVTVLGEDPESRGACTCESPSGYYLFTGWLHSQTPPVRCIDCNDAVPLYRLTSASRDDHYDVLSWSGAYEAIDRLWFESGFAEKLAQHQLTQHNSALSTEGRELAARYERETGSPFYLFLRSLEQVEPEVERRCPACDGNWRVEDPLARIALRCDPCRLVSELSIETWRAEHDAVRNQV